VQIHEGDELGVNLLSRRRVLGLAGLAMAGLGSGGILSACGADDGASGGGGGGGGAGGEGTKIAWAMNGPINDQSWEATHAQSMRAVEKAFPNAEVSYVDQVPFGKQGEQTFLKLAQDGNKLVFVTTAFGDDLARAAERSPDTIFMGVGEDKTSKNVGFYYVANWSVAYILGVAAGLLTKSNTLGYVASFPVANVFADVNGLLLGARSVNPDAEVRVVKIDSWYDPPKAVQAVNALVDQGADFVWHILGDTAVPQAAEKRGVWSAAWSLDARQVAPKGYVSTTLSNWDDYCVETARAVIQGDFKPPQFPPGDILELGKGVDRGDWGDRVPEDVRSEADAVRAKLMGGFNPFVGPIRDSKGKERVAEGEEIDTTTFLTWDWSFEGVNGI
jgi:basic membrane protein A and related proteins